MYFSPLGISQIGTVSGPPLLVLGGNTGHFADQLSKAEEESELPPSSPSKVTDIPASGLSSQQAAPGALAAPAGPSASGAKIVTLNKQASGNQISAGEQIDISNSAVFADPTAGQEAVHSWDWLLRSVLNSSPASTLKASSEAKERNTKLQKGSPEPNSSPGVSPTLTGQPSPVNTDQTWRGTEQPAVINTPAPAPSTDTHSVQDQTRAVLAASASSSLDSKPSLSLVTKPSGQINDLSTRSQIIHAASQTTSGDSPQNSSAVGEASTSGIDDDKTLAGYAFALRVRTAKQFQTTAAIGLISAREVPHNANSAGRQMSEKSASQSDTTESQPESARSAGADTAHETGHNPAESASSDAAKAVAPPEQTPQEQTVTPHDAPTQAFPNAVSGTFAATGSSEQPVQRDQASSTLTAAPEAPVQAANAPPAGPMKQLSVRVESTEGQSVDVRIVQRAGELHVAVKGADGDITQNLRHGLSDLASRLNDSGYHTETWQGNQAGPANGASGQNSRQQSSREGNSQSGNPGQNQQQNQSQRESNRNSSSRPHWIEELESSLTVASHPAGQPSTI